MSKLCDGPLDRRTSHGNPRGAYANRHKSEIVIQVQSRWFENSAVTGLKGLAVTMNPMRGKSAAGETWTTLRVRALRERLESRASILQPSAKQSASMIPYTDSTSASGSVLRLIKTGILPAQQLMPSAPWKVPLDALESKGGEVRSARCDRSQTTQTPRLYHQNKTLKLPGF